MKNTLILLLAVLIFPAFCFQTASAQFNIKIPKIGKPKTEQPKTNDGNFTPEPDSNANQNTESKSKSAVGFMPKPLPTNVPVLLKDSIDI